MTGNIKDDDLETYEFIWNIAMEMVMGSPKETLLHEIGTLLHTILNEWEKGTLKNIQTVNQALNVAKAYENFLSETLASAIDTMIENETA